MVLDAAKGVENQTRKLFEVCAMRGIPVLTFINKMDLPGRDPFELVAEVEEVLGIDACPHNWPIGTGKLFQGVAECDSGDIYCFEKTAVGGSKKAECEILSIEAARKAQRLSDTELETLEYELELIREAGNPFDREKFLQGKLTKVFFGSALTNFGLDPFFDAFIDIAPCPGSRLADKGDEELLVDPEQPFSGFVFKIQSNMDPKHRDSMAFLRVCSGKFSRDDSFCHVQSGKDVRLSRTHKMFAGDRETIDTAYPGDIIGVINPGVFSIGDTVSSEGNFQFKPLPQFSPEVVARIRPKSVMRRKAFDKGVEQLSQEGAVQVLYPSDGTSSEPLIAAVGRLQFEVLQFRLTHDYNVETVIEELPFSSGVWLVGDPITFKKHSRSLIAKDPQGRVAILFRSDHERQYSLEQNPDHSFSHFVQ
jgi:peptide chain release factor 3